jgi:hypothetical protein
MRWTNQLGAAYLVRAPHFLWPFVLFLPLRLPPAALVLHGGRGAQGLSRLLLRGSSAGFPFLPLCPLLRVPLRLCLGALLTTPLPASGPPAPVQTQPSRCRAAMRCSGGLDAPLLRFPAALALLFLLLPAFRPVLRTLGPPSAARSCDPLHSFRPRLRLLTEDACRLFG